MQNNRHVQMPSQNPDGYNSQQPGSVGNSYNYGMGKGSPARGASQPEWQPYGASAPQQTYGQQYGYQPQQTQPAQPVQQPMYQQQAYQQPQYVNPMQQQIYQPVQEQAPVAKKKRSKKFWILLIIAIICIALAAALLFSMFGGTGKSKRQGDLGQLDGKTAEEIQAELDRVVDEGMFNISIASIIEFANGTSPGELRIENVPGNHYLMKVFITRDDTGQQIYETDFIEPNYHIQMDTLDVALPAGTYACTARFDAYDFETEELVGQAAAKIEVVVDA